MRDVLAWYKNEYGLDKKDDIWAIFIALKQIWKGYCTASIIVGGNCIFKPVFF